LWYALRVNVFFLVEHEYNNAIPAKSNGKKINLKNNFNFKGVICL
jgi:hypothetical protein